MVKEVTEILELVLKIFAVIGGIAGAFIVVKKWYKGYLEKQNKFFYCLME